jgi:oligopeptide transport system ATP-binding protein
VKLLQVRDLHVGYSLTRACFSPKTVSKALNGVSFDLPEAGILGVVGERACGKSTLARALVRLVMPSAGRIRFDGRELLHLKPRDLRTVRRQMQLLLPDSACTLSRSMTAEEIVGEALDVQNINSPPPRQQRVRECLRAVGLEQQDHTRFPDELGASQRQRLTIARALAAEPRLLVCDEPFAELDLPEQARLLRLLVDLQQQHRFACLFLTQDLAALEPISHRILVMYLGRIVESGPARQITRFPRHPYTQALVSAMPTLEPGTRPRRVDLRHDFTPTTVSGCSFHPRCSVAEARCRAEPPLLREIVPDQQVACHLAR